MAAILNSLILNSIILDSAIWVFPLKLTHTCQDWFPPFAQKNFTHSLVPTICTKIFTHWFWLKLIMAAILNFAMLDSETLFSSLRFTPKHSHSTLTLTQLIQSDSNSFILTQLDDGSHLELAILDSDTAILDSDTLLSALRFTQKHSHSLWHWLRLIQFDSNLFILTQLEDGSHLEFCHPGFSHLRFSSETHSHLPRLVPTISTTKIFTLTSLSTIGTKKNLHSLILTQLDDGSHLQFCHIGFSHFAQKNFTHAFSLNLMMAAILNSAILDSDTAILDSDTLLSSLRFTQKHSHSTLTWTNSIWLKLIHSPLIGDGNHLEFCHFVFSHLSFPSQTHSHLPRLVPTICTRKPTLIHSDSTWWWQPSWILPSWIQPFCTKKLH